MANILYEIETLINDDNRLNQIAVKVIIRNSSDFSIKVQKIVPNIPNNVKLEEKADSFELDNKKEFKDLCDELSFIVENVMLSTNSDYRNNLIQSMSKVNKEFFSELPKFFKLKLINKTLYKIWMDEFKKSISRLRYEINTIDDAEWAYDSWIKSLEENHPEKKMFEAKQQQLENLSAQIGMVNSKYIAIVEPGSFYSRTYVLHFERKTLSTKIYNLSFDSIYTDEMNSHEYRANVSTSINISPKALTLTLFAAFASILGTILKYCMNTLDKINDTKSLSFDLDNKLILSGIMSIIIAVLFFNVFEFTEIGKKIKTGVNWRTALTIGILAGLFGDKLILAVKVFVGL